MIRKPLTTVTINNDPTANALKPGTEQLIKAFKIGDREEAERIPRGLTTWTKDPKELRRAGATGMKAMKKMRGSAEQRRIVKMKNPPHMTHLYDKSGKFIG